ncbi:hypothetical protein [Hydrogenophaga sp.]|uniref:hypothetical protein n=1 Tax=Hydrogenophaga sp. TaxID=1904254 RepID=UPI00271C4EEA|nr:hypothetical protein [Hydrogenophaga sp.]MDO9606672.1 hypothetical protein [Hydrogenophaga sp.]
MLAKRVDRAWVFAVHARVIPCNTFWVLSIWRHAEARPWMRAVSAVWLLVAFAISVTSKAAPVSLQVLYHGDPLNKKIICIQGAKMSHYVYFNV